MPAETLVEYSTQFLGSDGHVYDVYACGRERPDGLWEGWLEFSCRERKLVRRTERESLQPNREDLVRWAMSISPFHLDDALDRALELVERHEADLPLRYVPQGPFERRAEPAAAPVQCWPDKALLDPFEVYASGEAALRARLGALAAWQLRNIARSHAIIVSPRAAEACEKAELVERIVGAARSAASRADWAAQSDAPVRAP